MELHKIIGTEPLSHEAATHIICTTQHTQSPVQIPTNLSSYTYTHQGDPPPRLYIDHSGGLSSIHPSVRQVPNQNETEFCFSMCISFCFYCIFFSLACLLPMSILPAASWRRKHWNIRNCKITKLPNQTGRNLIVVVQ